MDGACPGCPSRGAAPALGDGGGAQACTLYTKILVGQPSDPPEPREHTGHLDGGSPTLCVWVGEPAVVDGTSAIFLPCSPKFLHRPRLCVHSGPVNAQCSESARPRACPAGSEGLSPASGCRALSGARPAPFLSQAPFVHTRCPPKRGAGEGWAVGPEVGWPLLSKSLGPPWPLGGVSPPLGGLSHGDLWPPRGGSGSVR